MCLHILATTCRGFAVAPQLELEITSSTHPHHVFPHFQTNNSTVCYIMFTILHWSWYFVFKLCFWTSKHRLWNLAILLWEVLLNQVWSVVDLEEKWPGVKCFWSGREMTRCEVLLIWKRNDQVWSVVDLEEKWPGVLLIWKRNDQVCCWSGREMLI